MQSEKAQLRREVRSCIAAMSAIETAAASARISQAVVDLVRKRDVRCIAAYLATDGEVNLDDAVAALLDDGRLVACPVVDWASRTMRFDRLVSLSDVAIANKSIREPVGGQTIEIARIELLIVPGVAFDREGRRLGRGGGFYDRLLAEPTLRAATCGVAFNCQIVERVPTEGHDQLVGMVITPSGVQNFKGRH